MKRRKNVENEQIRAELGKKMTFLRKKNSKTVKVLHLLVLQLRHRVLALNDNQFCSIFLRLIRFTLYRVELFGNFNPNPPPPPPDEKINK